MPDTITGLTVEVLCDSWARIEDTDHWAVNMLAADRYNAELPVRHPRADKWCAMGAVWREAGLRAYEWQRENALTALREAARELYDEPISVVNDTRTHADVERCYAWAVAYTISGQ